MTPEEVLAVFQKGDFAREGKVFEFYKDIFLTTFSSTQRIDTIIRSTSRNWEIDRMAVIDRCILRLAVCELAILRDAPAPVIIDEAIELAKKYSTEKSGKFVNGVLDSIARSPAVKSPPKTDEPPVQANEPQPPANA